MENSDILHGKILQNLSSVCKIFAKIACNIEKFRNCNIESFIVLGFSLMFSGPKNSFFPLNLDWNPASISEERGQKRNTQVKFEKIKKTKIQVSLQMYLNNE